jgi:3-phenylpropionate/trans-cinnamate dioxygenase ferredoxin reductase subunit
VPETYVIVGGGLTGAKAAESLRDAGFAGRVMLVGDDTERPYERPPLSKGYLLGKDPRDKAFVHTATWYGEHDIDLLLGVRATALDPGSRTLTLDGFEPVRYDKLLLATGSRVRPLDVPGADLNGVRYLRSLPDADRLVDAFTEGAQVVVIGAGWIGLETAAAARTHGGTVTVVEAAGQPLQRVLGDELGAVFADLHRAHGVDLRLSAGVAGFEGSGGKLTGVRLADGTLVPATVAIVGIGIVPNTELASLSGLAVDNGVVTDERLRTSDPAIYAAGDVASSFNPLLGKHVRVEHWANALNGGITAGQILAGQDVVYDRVPYFFSDQYDLGMEYAGYVEPGGYDRVVFRGDPEGGEFLAFWLAGDRVLAGMNVNVWDVQDDIQNLVRAGYAGTPVDAARLADPGVPMADLLP